MRSPKTSDKQKPQTAKQKANERLAKALRDNLHRRKTQARARASASPTYAGSLILYGEESSANRSEMLPKSKLKADG